MLKKILAVLLAAVLAVSVAACTGGENKSSSSEASKAEGNAGEADPYAEHLEFTVLSLDDAPDFMEYPQVKKAMEKFNFSFEIQQVAWDNWDETTRTLVATDSLPEVDAWYNLNYSEYLQWVEQGVFKAFPEDMSKYPELKEIMESYDIFDKIKVDGKLYAFPKVINSNPWNDYANLTVMYRRDWAKAMGYQFEPVQVISWTDLVKYLEDLKEKDPGKLGDKLVPFDTGHGGLSWVDVTKQWNPYIDNFKETEDGYVFGGDDSSSITAINKIKELYTKGLLAKDAYADKNEAGTERWQAGRSGVYYGTFSPQYIQTYCQPMMVSEGLTSEDFGVFAIKQDDGKFPIYQKSEWWGAFAFSGNCRDEVMDRWLAVGNWLLEDEQVEEYAYGTEGEDWSKDVDGKVTINWTDKDIAAGAEKAYITDQKAFQKFFILEGLDVWLPGNPSIDSYFVDTLYKGVIETYATAPNYKPSNYDLDYFSGTEKDKASGLAGEVRDTIVKAVVDDNPEQVWNDFVTSKKAETDAVCKELNEALMK